MVELLEYQVKMRGLKVSPSNKCLHCDNVFRLLDLAGCEKAKDAPYTSKKAFKECGDINQSLFALKSV